MNPDIANNPQVQTAAAALVAALADPNATKNSVFMSILPLYTALGAVDPNGVSPFTVFERLLPSVRALPSMA